MMDPAVGWSNDPHAGHTSNGFTSRSVFNGNHNTRMNSRTRDQRSSHGHAQRQHPHNAPDHIPIVGRDPTPPDAMNHRNDSSQSNETSSSIYSLEQNNGDLVPVFHCVPWVKRVYSSPPVLGLHEEINDFYEFMKPFEEEEFMRSRVVKRIESVVLRLWPESKVEIFGSFATKLYLPTSDIDLMILGKWDSGPPLHTLRNELLQAGVANEDEIKVLDKASVPIVKVVDRETDVRVDISFNTSNGVNSANLVKEFIVKFPCLVKLVYVLKQFLYQRRLNEVFTGGISSYSLILMTISFLQLHPRQEAQSPRHNLGVLLIEFFELYGQMFNYHKVGIRVKDGGSYVKKSEILEQMDSVHRPGILCIEDPLNIQNDIGRSSFGALDVKKAFDWAFLKLRQVCGPTAPQKMDGKYSILSQIVKVEDEVIERRERVRRQFGPILRQQQSSNSTSAASVPPPAGNSRR